MKGKKILIVEDDLAISDYAAITLRNQGCEVETAADGKSGLEKAASFKPDLVVLDLMLPGVHGYEVCSRLKKDQTRNGVKVLITSSKSFSADIAGAQEAGADDYLTKPYQAPQLVERVKALLDGTAKGIPDAETVSAETRIEPIGAGPESAAALVPAPEKPAEPGSVSALAKPAKKRTGIKIKFWGTRGSSPAPGPFTMRYGGNTSCTEIRLGNELIIVDCGSGVRELGIALLKEYGEKRIDGHIFVGHTHWDHIQGFPFFTPLYVPQNHFTVYSVRGAGKSLERVFRGQMAADYFPVPLKSLSSHLKFVELEEAVTIGEAKVSYFFLNHPGVSIGFRFEYAGKVISYLSDHETFWRLGGKNDHTKRQDDAVAAFAKGSDILICEAQYDEKEYEAKKGWGHSTFNDVVDRALQAEAKHLILFHHDPEHTDEIMDGYVEHCNERIRAAGSMMRCTGAQEKETLIL